MLEDFIKKISTITKKVVLYRTTHLESLELNLPENVSLQMKVLLRSHSKHSKSDLKATLIN